jgi:anti-sigma B factor antagonist
MQPDPPQQPPIHETPFLMDVERRGGSAVVTLSGSCTMNESASLRECVDRLASTDVRLIVLDMASLDFIESMGLGGIIAAYLRLRHRHGELRLVAPQPSIMHVLRLTRLTQLFEIFETVDKALA